MCPKLSEGHEFEFQNVQNKHESCSQYSYTLKGLCNLYIFAELSFFVMLTYPFVATYLKWWPQNS